MLQGLVNEIFSWSNRFLLRQGHRCGGDDFGIGELRILQGAAESILHQELLQIEVCLRLNEALLVCGDCILCAHNLDGRQAANLNLLLIV